MKILNYPENFAGEKKTLAYLSTPPLANQALYQ